MKKLSTIKKQKMVMWLLVLTFLPIISFLEVRAQSSEIRVHDPVMIRQDGRYYLFSTGHGISVFSSPDLKDWKKEKPVFEEAPTWAVETVPSFKGHIWAPDISYHDGTYYLYYSVSAFGKNTSAIGLATNKTLNPADPNYKWTDHGKVIQSVPGRDMWNAIDPNLIWSKEGQPWLTFGSFWNGIKLVRLNKDLKSVDKDPEEWLTLASRPRDFGTADTLAGQGAIEAPFIFQKGDYYYLFVSTDYCCRGEKSTYKMVVGRSKELEGPYVDKAGVPMTQGGGTLVLQGDENWYGVGHNSVYTFDGTDYIVFHGYDATDEGKPKLRIEKLNWDSAGWPLVTEE